MKDFIRQNDFEKFVWLKKYDILKLMMSYERTVNVKDFAE